MKAPKLSTEDILYIGLGGMLGSLLRSWIETGYTGAFPVPTILVNILGAAALAILHASQHRIHAQGRYLYMVGFCGSFTTVSLFSFETIALFRAGEAIPALLNLFLPVAVAFGTVWWIVRRFDQPQRGRGEA